MFLLVQETFYILLVTKRRHAKVRNWDGIQGAESWDTYEYSQRNRRWQLIRGLLGPIRELSICW